MTKLIASLLLVTSFLAGTFIATASAFAGKDCTCRYRGKNIPEGQSTCIKTANGYKVAQCSRVLNNTSWKFTTRKCPIG